MKNLLLILFLIPCFVFGQSVPIRYKQLESYPYTTVTKITDTSFTLNRPNGTRDTIVVSLENGNKGDLTVNSGWTNWTINAGAIGASQLANTAVTPGSYTNTNITVDADGRIIAASNGSGGAGANLFRELKFIVGGTNAPANGDSVFTYAAYISNKLNITREGELQTDSLTANGIQFNATTGAITFHPPLLTGEKIIIQAYPTADWSYDGLVAAAGYDASAQAYFDAIEGAGGSLTNDQKTAYNTFIVALKNASIFTTHFDFLHILAGGSNAAVKFNLISPLNTDAAYRLEFPNGATYAATGLTTDGVDDYIQTHAIMSAAAKAGTNDYHVAVYNRTATSAAGFTFGVNDGDSRLLYGLIRATDNITYIKQPNSGEDNFADATTGKGFYYSQTQAAAANVTTYKDGVQKIALANNGNGYSLPTLYKLYFNAYNNIGTPSQFRAGELCIISFGKAMNDAQRQAYETAIANLVTALGL